QILAWNYRLTPEEKKKLNDLINQGLKLGKIRPSNSPYAAPVFFISKKDGSKRLVQDYQKLNEITIPDQFLLPRIDQLLDELKNVKMFNKLDIVWGYNNLQIRKGDE